MIRFHEQVVLDKRGRPCAVQLPLKDYHRLLNFLEDAADLRVSKVRMKEPRIPLAQVTEELKRDGLL